MNHTSGVTSPDEASDTELDDFIRALKSQVIINIMNVLLSLLLIFYFYIIYIFFTTII
jgi:hypothetical protein